MEDKTLFEGIESPTENGEESDSGRITGKALFRKLAKQQYRCHLSGVLLDVDDASLDHIVPLSRGGTHTIDNIAIVHAAINRMKGTMSEDEFIGWCRKVVEWRR